MAFATSVFFDRRKKREMTWVSGCVARVTRGAKEQEKEKEKAMLVGKVSAIQALMHGCGFFFLQIAVFFLLNFYLLASFAG